MTSIRDLGLSNPIRVFERPDGTGYELVQGFRRLSAYKALSEAQAGQGGYDKIPALILPGEADIAGLYRRMVDENVIRKDLSLRRDGTRRPELRRRPGDRGPRPQRGCRRIVPVRALFKTQLHPLLRVPLGATGRRAELSHRNPPALSA